jgi:hypothetical protein
MGTIRMARRYRMGAPAQSARSRPAPAGTSALVRLGVSGYNRSTPMAANRVTVYRTTDPIQADMLGALLRENGIAACVLGTRHGAAIGVGQHILALHIEVPQAQAGAATDFLEAFFESDGAALLAEHAGFAPDDELAGDHDDVAGERASRAASVALAAGSRAPGTWALAAGVAAIVLGALIVALMVAMGALAGALRGPAPGDAPTPAVQPAH